ncbi:hypothetical protein [Lacipirellula sp.]|uniref:hypothetical protein n=1 Tax=Lacipirellula sp. TaxID=2691419 RepID=UPI003D0F4E62
MQTTEQLLDARRRGRDSTLRTPAAGGAGLTGNEFCAVEVVEPPAPPRPIEPRELTLLTLIELVLKDRRRLYQALRVPAATPVMLPRLLAISLAGFVLYGLAMSLVFTATDRWPSLTALPTWLDSPRSTLLQFAPIESTWGKLGPWINGEAAALVTAYAFGLIAASAVCLPSLYFYCLLAGVRMTMLEVVLHTVKSKAVAAVALVGILPIYVAFAMGIVIFGGGELALAATMWLGLVLPFIAGLWGTVALYQGFAPLCDTMAADRRARRECFLRRLVLSWSACYTAVVPVMIYTIWETLSRA